MKSHDPHGEIESSVCVILLDGHSIINETQFLLVVSIGMSQ